MHTTSDESGFGMPNGRGVGGAEMKKEQVRLLTTDGSTPGGIVAQEQDAIRPTGWQTCELLKTTHQFSPSSCGERA